MKTGCLNKYSTTTTAYQYNPTGRVRGGQNIHWLYPYLMEVEKQVPKKPSAQITHIKDNRKEKYRIKEDIVNNKESIAFVEKE